jgi:AraC family transcriptional activator of mtrCDE
MSNNPNIYLDDPDPLSVLLSRLELNAEVYVNGNFCGTWAVDTAGSKRIPFHLIGSGNAWLHFEDDKPQPLSQGDLVVFPRDSHHIISDAEAKPDSQQVNTPMSNDGAITNMVCGFFEFRNPALFPVLESLPGLILIASGQGRVGRLVNMILEELAESRPGHYSAVDQLAFLIFVETIRRQLSSGQLNDGFLMALLDPRIGRTLNAIHQRPELAWTLEMLADKAAMSRSSFTERFTKQVGITPMKYLTKWRMTEARRLLTNTALSTAQVAEKSGYESEAAFRKAFKNTLGVTPGAVRAG